MTARPIALAAAVAAALAAAPAGAGVTARRAGLSGSATGGAERGFRARPGQTVYVHLELAGREATPVSLGARVERGNSILTKAIDVGRIEPGARRAVAAVPLPDDAPAGTYTLILLREDTYDIVAKLDLTVALVAGGTRAEPTEIDAAAFIAAVERVGGRTLTRAQRRALRKAVAAANARGDTVKGARLFCDLARLDGSDGLAKALNNLLGRIRGEGGLEPWRTTAAILIGSNEVVVAGTPPLTEASVNAYLELAEFQARLLLGDESYRVPRALRRQTRRALIAHYARADAAFKQALANLPVQWLQVRGWWASQPAAERAAIVAQYQQTWLQQQQQQAALDARQRAAFEAWQRRQARATAPGRAPVRRWGRREFQRMMGRKQTEYFVQRNMMNMTMNSFRFGSATLSGFEP
ncbi:MAG: hypothetical protein D6689_07475 [Deltaproteobacteria bacterium]|nr:MAG: hypothetical protein D6689_07475 [Deltaproteobacteria bacterium]